MSGLGPDASNCCIPASYSGNLRLSFPPLPSTNRGEPTVLDGQAGRIHAHRALFAYASGRLIVLREIGTDETNDRTVLVYRGHTAAVTCAKFSPSGCYIASGDVRGKLRVWSVDNEEHLCKLELAALSGPIRDISWDLDSKRICIVGEGSKSDPTSLSARVIQWDTGVSCGDLAQHHRKRTLSCSFKPNRPMRIVTSGPNEDPRCLFHEGPPFRRCAKEHESAHGKGDVHAVRYNPAGTLIASVGGTDVCIYNGSNMELIRKVEKVHDGSIYSCAWDDSGQSLLTCAADGTVKLLDMQTFTTQQVWNPGRGKNEEGAELNISPLKRAPVSMGNMQVGCAFVQGTQPISVSLNGELHILSNFRDNAYSVRTLSGHRSSISCLAVDPKAENIIYTGDADGIICLWDLSTKHSQRVVRNESLPHGESSDADAMNRLHLGAITGMVIVDGALASIGWDDKLRWTHGNVSKKSLQLPAQPKKIIRGKNLVIILTCQGILLFKRDDKFKSLSLQLSYEALCATISSDDSTLYVGGNDRTIHVYQIQGHGDSLKEVFSLSQCHLQPITSIRLSHDETKLASADSRDVCVWNVYDKLSAIIPQGRWCFHRLRINALAWSSDDAILASASEDDSIFLWSLDHKLKRIHYPFAHRGGITDIDFLPSMDGTMLLSVGNDGCINLWDLTKDIQKTFC